MIATGGYLGIFARSSLNHSTCFHYLVLFVLQIFKIVVPVLTLLVVFHPVYRTEDTDETFITSGQDYGVSLSQKSSAEFQLVYFFLIVCFSCKVCAKLLIVMFVTQCEC